MAGKKDIGMILIITIAVLVAITFLTAIANSVVSQTQYNTATDESLNIASARIASNNINQSKLYNLTNGYALTGKSPVTNVVVKNSSGSVITSSNYTINETYGVINFLNTTYMVSGTGSGNITLITYSYPPANYIIDGSSRTVVGLIIIFGALAIIGYVIVEVMKSGSMQNLLKYGVGEANEVTK